VAPVESAPVVTEPVTPSCPTGMTLMANGQCSSVVVADPTPVNNPKDRVPVAKPQS
jgi:hypothetical protein